jgi:hypothetical protein
VAKNDTFIKQVRYEILTDKSNESIHLQLPTPTYGRTILLLGAFYLYFYFYFYIVFALGGSPTPHPISSRPHFVCKFSRHGSSSPVTSHLAPSITVLVFPYSADA